MACGFAWWIRLSFEAGSGSCTVQPLYCVLQYQSTVRRLQGSGLGCVSVKLGRRLMQCSTARCTTQAQIALLEAAIEASAAKAAALKARAEQGEVAQGRLCLAPGAQAGGSSSSNAGPAGAGTSGVQQGEDADCAGGQVALEDLSKAVAAAYQR
jgi:hypothetical protein